MGSTQILFATSELNVIPRALDLRELFFINDALPDHQQEIRWLLY